jgi:cytidine deaminase
LERVTASQLKRYVKTILPDNLVQEMIRQARRASERAYCPYSRFRVGAAVLTGAGKIVAGCNVENASYGLTICAERSAIFRAIAQGATRICAVLVYTPTDKPTAPCGACRQVINEFGRESIIISVCDGRMVMRRKLSALLAEPFGPHNL